VAKPRKAAPAIVTADTPGAHIFWRERGGRPRAYGDFRSIGGAKEALRPAGQTRATTDPVVADRLFRARVAELERSQAWGTGTTRRGADLTGIGDAVTEYVTYLRTFTSDTPAWINSTERMLRRAAGYFGKERPLASIDAKAVTGLIRWLREQPCRKRVGFSEGTVIHSLNCLSKLWRHGWREGWVPQGVSPIRDLRPNERPAKPAPEDFYLTTAEAARLLEAARTFPAGDSGLMRMAYPMIGAMLLTGGRADEVLGLTVDDIDLQAGTVHFRRTAYRTGRGGKTPRADRIIPLWPQLREILAGYLSGGYRDTLAVDFVARGKSTSLLFPSPDTAGRITDVRKVIDRCAKRAGLPVDKIRSRVTRRTYCTARSATLWGGQPVPEYVVVAEMGHRDSNMVAQVYRKVSRDPHRADVVEYRITNGTENGANPAPSPSVADRQTAPE
jgi:integrase